MTECLEWAEKMLKPFRKNKESFDTFITPITQESLYNRLRDKIISKNDNDDEILESYISQLSNEEVSILYYKNNMKKFIDDHENIQNLIIAIFSHIKNLNYIYRDDDHWVDEIPGEYYESFYNKTKKDWNNFVDTQYFLNPNDVPDSIQDDLSTLRDYLMKYVYCRYLAPDRIYRLKNFKRGVVTVIDTDSNILSLDTMVNHIFDSVIKDNDFGRDKMNNIFICINMLAFMSTSAVQDILATFGKYSNVPEEYRPIYNMKNEFFFSKLLIGTVKKRYISKIVLREGNLMNPPKNDVKGFDFKKATTSEESEKFFMSLVKKYIINANPIDVRGLIIEITAFKNAIRQSIENGETKYLPNLNAKVFKAYKDPASQQSVKAVLSWNFVEPNDQIELPSKVSALKLNIFTEDDIADLQYSYPDIYQAIIDNIFNDTHNIFVKKTWDYGIDYSNGGKEWYKKIPKKYQSKYKKLGYKKWNEFVDEFTQTHSEKECEGHYIIKKKGMEVLAIPSNAKIPDWVKPYIDYNTIINDITAPFAPVMEVLGVKTLEEGKTRNGISRKTNSITNIIKF